MSDSLKEKNKWPGVAFLKNSKCCISILLQQVRIAKCSNFIKMRQLRFLEMRHPMVKSFPKKYGGNDGKRRTVTHLYA